MAQYQVVHFNLNGKDVEKVEPTSKKIHFTPRMRPRFPPRPGR